jgi:hypothetical protein
VIDLPHDVCLRQYRKRRQFYKQCAYRIKMIDGKADVADGPVDEGEDAASLPKGVPLFSS